MRYRIIRRALTVMLGSFVIAASAVVNIAPPSQYPEVDGISVQRTMVSGQQPEVTDAAFELEQKAERAVTQRWMATVDELASMPDNWDGEGAKAVPGEIADNARMVIEATRDNIDCLDDIYPTELGTLCMQWKSTGGSDRVNAEIGRTRMAFYTHIAGLEFVAKKPTALDEALIRDMDYYISMLRG